MRAGSRFNEARKLGPVDMICGGVFDTKMRLQFLDLVAPRKVGNLAVSNMVYIVLVTLQVTSAMAPERMSMVCICWGSAQPELMTCAMWYTLRCTCLA